LLLEKDVDINKVGEYGDTPLLVAAETGNTEIVKLLLEKDADINKTDNIGHTPLLVAAETVNPTMANILLENGADINKASNNGYTPLLAAARAGNTEMVKLLLEKDTDINKADHKNRTPLIISQLIGHNNITELLENTSIVDKFLLEKPNHTQEERAKINKFTTEQNILFMNRLMPKANEFSNYNEEKIISDIIDDIKREPDSLNNTFMSLKWLSLKELMKQNVEVGFNDAVEEDTQLSGDIVFYDAGEIILP
jgi:hypothetical protein